MTIHNLQIFSGKVKKLMKVSICNLCNKVAINMKEQVLSKFIFMNRTKDIKNNIRLCICSPIYVIRESCHEFSMIHTGKVKNCE